MLQFGRVQNIYGELIKEPSSAKIYMLTSAPVAIVAKVICSIFHDRHLIRGNHEASRAISTTGSGWTLGRHVVVGCFYFLSSFLVRGGG